jgi:pimeloyl-ACP methyl ester carboxylesterase
MRPGISLYIVMGLLLPLVELDFASEAGSEWTALQAAADTTPRLKEAWVGNLSVGAMQAVMQFRIVIQPAGDTVAFFDSVTEGQVGFPATWSVVGDTLAFSVARIRLTYRGKLNDAGDTAEGIWTQGGRSIPLTLKRQAQEYTTFNLWVNRPQRPVGPFPYDSEDVTFENPADSVTLAGTLTLPKGPGPHPAVVLISGSGPQDRDQSLMEHKPFLVLADYLTRRGIAVLRYDDRGTARSTGRFGPATSEDFARDAGAAVAFLVGHPRVNAKEIGLVGHSEGGLVAPMVAGARGDVAFLVLMAGPGIDGATILLSQAEITARANGASEVDIKRLDTLNRAAFAAAVRNLPEPQFMAYVEPTIQEVTRDLPEASRAAAVSAMRVEMKNAAAPLTRPWTRYFMAYDPRPALRRLSQPVLAITGTRDTQVLAPLNVPGIRQALTEGGNRDFEIIELEGLNHLFQMSQTGMMNEYVNIQETINPVALKTIGDWIVRHTTPVR